MNLIYLNLFYLFCDILFANSLYFSVDTPHVVIKTWNAPLLIYASHNCLQRWRHNCRSCHCDKFCQSFLLALSGHSVACSLFYFFFLRFVGVFTATRYITASLSLSYVGMYICMYAVRAAGNTRFVVLVAPALPFADALLGQHSLLWLFCHEGIQVNMY